MTVDARDTKFCNALYNTAITNEPDSQRAYIILWILCLIGAFIVLIFWCWVRQRHKQKALGHVDQANRSFLYIYKFLLYIYMALVGAQTILMTLEVMLIEIFAVSFDNFFISLIQSVILTIPHFQMALIAFLYTKNTLGAKAFTRALKIAIPYALLTFIVCLLDERSLLTNVSGDKISISAVMRVIIDLLFECACMFIVCRQCQYQWKRKTVILRYLIVVMILTGFVFVAQIFESGRADGNCITQIGFYAWYIFYPFIFFKTVKDDSDYHWMFASKPLIESTQQSIADLDLFSLPGYHGVHFESMEDKKFRFKKLKQMVSGYVPIIPFNKIKFDNNTIDKVENVGRGGAAPHPSPPSSPRSTAMARHNGQSKSGTTTKLASPSRSNRKKSQKVKDNQTIGAGSTSKVYRGMYKQQPVAVKCLTRLDKKSDMSWSDLTLIFRESVLSSSLTHPNVVKFMGASLTYNGFFLVYEYCVYGDLQQIIVEHSHPEEPKLSCIPQRLWYLLDIAEGMKFLHRSGFVHRDLKTANVVVNYSKKNQRFVGKICDFGVSRKLPQDQEEQMNKNSEAHNRFNKSMNRSLDAVSDQHSHRASFVDDASSNLTVNSNATAATVATATPSSQGGAAAAESASTISEQQWQRFASRGNTKEITRTIHVGTPAFLAPEILLKLVRSKGVDLEKEQKKQKKRERKRLQEKLKRKKDRKAKKLKERERKRKQPQREKPVPAAGSIQSASGVPRALNNIDEEKENERQGTDEEEEEEEEEEETESEEDEEVNDETPNHYVRGAITDHNIDPHIYCDFATDVFSYGMILWSIITSKLPYKGFKPMDMILMIKNAQRLNISDREWKRWERCKELDIEVEKLQDLLERCWAQFPYQRPTFEQIADVLKSVITESHRKSSNPPKVTIEPDSMLTYNTTVFVQSDTR